MTLIIAGFTDSDVPKTGLTPAITIFEASHPTDPTTKTVNAQNMTESGLGLYVYNVALDVNKKYSVYIDGGAAIAAASERYKLGNVDPSKETVKFL